MALRKRLRDLFGPVGRRDGIELFGHIAQIANCSFTCSTSWNAGRSFFNASIAASRSSYWPESLQVTDVYMPSFIPRYFSPSTVA